MPNAVLTPYLLFGGRADEAIEYYCSALGAKQTALLRYSDHPDEPPEGTLPAGFEDKVMHAELRIAGAVLMLSDGSGPGGSFRGFRLSLTLPSAAAAQAAFFALSEDGTVDMPICETFWSPCFGMVTDKFGVGWMITVMSKPPA
ncbi:MAG: hypothetical protein CMJ58_21005 [Planctomycetaceae bacterium]|nr:hypothetical protein [Planctomycetaceae bacterium]